MLWGWGASRQPEGARGHAASFRSGLPKLARRSNLCFPLLRQLVNQLRSKANSDISFKERNQSPQLLFHLRTQSSYSGTVGTLWWLWIWVGIPSDHLILWPQWLCTPNLQLSCGGTGKSKDSTT